MQVWAVHLKDNEDVDAGQDDPGNGHLRLHVDEERLVGHGQRHHLVVLQEGLEGDDDGIAADDKQKLSTPTGAVYLTGFHAINRFS